MTSTPGVHPGPLATTIPGDMARAIVEQARGEDPLEACGIIIGSAPAAGGGIPLRYLPTRNAAASPYRYEVDPLDLLRIVSAADDADEAVWGIVHSHTHTPAVPSPTDIGIAVFYTDALYLLVSLDDDLRDPLTGAPSLRAWRIVDGSIHEVELVIEG
jgi:proteasome lid subunit RPN8/RPN11